VNRVELFHLFPDVALPQGNIDHRRLDVGVAHGFHDCEGIRTRHGHLRSEGVAKPMNANVGDASAFAGAFQIPEAGGIFSGTTAARLAAQFDPFWPGLTH
jgi:hypothetical protein